VLAPRHSGAVRPWLILTPEYPPTLGGVGDFTRHTALGLAGRGESVRIFTAPGHEPPVSDPALEVEALPDRFGAGSRRVLERAFRESAEPPIVFLQYVPQGFGMRGLNLPFLLWLAARAPHLRVLFHEVVYPFIPRQPLKHDVLALGTRLMLATIASRAERCWITTEGWAPYLRRWARLRAEPRWSPVPSNLPGSAVEARSTVRRKLGLPADAPALFHFGTYSPTVIEPFKDVLPSLLEGHPERRLLLLGRGGERFRSQVLDGFPHLGERLLATGALPAQHAADAMAACDVGLYPFPDGVSGRRTSLMASLDLGVPALTTEGALTEPLWRESRAVGLAPALDRAAFAKLVDQQLAQPEELRKLGQRGRELYREQFSLERLLDRLLAP
jgi:glycosyltransferase involved in cell wall biosynthesis